MEAIIPDITPQQKYMTDLSLLLLVPEKRKWNAQGLSFLRSTHISGVYILNY